MSKFPSVLSPDNAKKLLGLATRVFKIEESQVTKEQMLFIVQMDMKTFITEISVSASATRPTEIKYATNNYYASAKLDISGMSSLMFEHLDKCSEEELLDRYFEMKQAIYTLIEIKYESMESFLRNLLLSSEKKDNCPLVGRFNNE
jgi:hypothetical protein